MNQSQSAGGVNVFVYGTLMFEPVWSRVVDGFYESTQANLSDHRRYRLQGETYPGAMACSGKVVKGLVYHDVSPTDVAKLDAFEGPDYARRSVEVHTVDGKLLSAEFYLWLKPAQALTSTGSQAGLFKTA